MRSPSVHHVGFLGVLSLAALSTGCREPGPAQAHAAIPLAESAPLPAVDAPTAGPHRNPRAPVGLATDPELLRAFALTRGFRLGTPERIQVTADGKSVLFLRSGPRTPRQTLFELDVATQTTKEILTPERLVAGPETLSREERARRERLRISASGFAGFELSKDGTRVLVALSGRLYVLTRATGAIRELPTGKGAAFDGHFSFDGRKVAYVKDHDVYVIGVDSGSETRVTTGGTEDRPHGEAEFIAQEELDRSRGFFWSPDGRQILFEEADSSNVERLTIADPAHPEAEPDRPHYPRPGRPNAELRFGLSTLNEGGAKPTWVTWDRGRYPYVSSVAWSKGAPPTMLVFDRLQKNAALLAIDAATGQTRTLVAEHDDAWINVDATAPLWTKDGTHFVWSQERTGRYGLELRKSSGELVRPLTPSILDYRALVHIDDRNRLVYFLASDEPAESALYKVSLDGGEPTLVQGGKDRTVSATFGEGDEVFVSHEMGRTELPKSVVRRVQSTLVESAPVVVPSVAEAPAGLRPVELTRVGKDEMRAAIVRPKGFQPGKTYPVIDAAYGGPSITVVAANALSYVRSQWIADATGAIVVAIDGKGTPRRGRAWEREVLNKLGAVPLESHVAALAALGAAFPEMDMTRVGVIGWSFGGYFSASAVLARPDVFKAGVAGAAPVDWLDYDTAYTERYLGLPSENGAAYESASVLHYLKSKEGPVATGRGRPLLVIHGTADDNVFFFNSMKLVDALERAGHAYEFLPLAGVTHQLADPALNVEVWSRVASFFRSELGSD